jgi:putative ABC transport system substrate-binding protein
MNRREFIALVGGATATPMFHPIAAGAQQAKKIPTIGFLSSSTATAELSRRIAFVRRLAEMGWVEGRGVMIEYRAEGAVQRAGEIAAEFVGLKVDTIVIAGDAQVLAAKRATGSVPIVFAAAGDPVGNGVVASLARPGGNITGLSVQLPDTAGKRIEFLHEIFPGLGRLAILGNAPTLLATADEVIE